MCPELLLYTLLTHDCSAKYLVNHNVKFADDTAVEGLISHNTESFYRQEEAELVDGCRVNNLCINVGQTEEMVVDFRRRGYTPSSSEEKLWKWSPVSSMSRYTFPTTSCGS